MSEFSRISRLTRYGLEELKFLRSFEDLRILGAKVAYMDMDLFRRIITEASEIGVKRIHLFLRGEPTLHPNIFEMIAFIKSKGLAVHLTTNGTTLTPERSAKLLATGVNSADQLTVSFIGHSKENHEATMVGVDHGLVVGNILALMRLRKELRVNGPVVETILNPTPATRHETEEFLRFWQGKVDHVRIGGISLSFQEYKRERADSVVRTTPCTQAYERMPVTWDGRVPQCVTDFDGDWIVGDLNRDSIMDVWNCERMQTIRRIHQERRFEELPLCLHCDM
jgi:radical SAM protein with 4Fe4S-binding SPASM domain